MQLTRTQKCKAVVLLKSCLGGENGTSITSMAASFFTGEAKKRGLGVGEKSGHGGEVLLHMYCSAWF